VRLLVPTGSNKWYQSKVHLGVTGVAEGALVVAGVVMTFSGSSGGEVVGPCVSLCVVARGNWHGCNGSCVGPIGCVVLDCVSRRRGGQRSSPKKKRHVSPEKEGIHRTTVCRSVHGSRCGDNGSCVGLAGRLCSTGVCRQRRTL
jgi:hypothetical protein